MKKRNLLFPIFTAALALGSCQFESFDKRCAREAKEYTEQHCPLRLDPCTVMDSLKYEPESRTLQYYYTLEGLLDSTDVLTDEVVAGFREQLREDIVNSVQLRKYKEENIHFNYIYISKSTGKTSLFIEFTPDEYKTGNSRTSTNRPTE